MMVCQDCGLVIISEVNKQTIERPSKSKHSRKIMGSITLQTHDDKPKEKASFNHDEEVFKKWQKLFQVSDATEKNLVLALFEITKIGNSVLLSKNILGIASNIYKKTVEERLTKKRSTRSLSATIVYMACRQCGIPRTLKEIAYASRVDPKEIRCNYGFLMRKLNFSAKPVKANQYINMLTDQLSMQRKVIEIADKIIEITRGSRFSQGKNPIGLVAAACYMASILIGETKTQREIAEAARITEATIRNRYKELANHLLFTVSL